MAHFTLDKDIVLLRIHDEGDTIPDLLEWTKNQPESRLSATYNRKGNVWEQLMEFRNDRLNNLPEVVTERAISYLLESQDKKDWMFYTVICWILRYYNPHGMHDPENKQQIMGMFKKTQGEKLVPAVT